MLAVWCSTKARFLLLHDIPFPSSERIPRQCPRSSRSRSGTDDMFRSGAKCRVFSQLLLPAGRGEIWIPDNRIGLVGTPSFFYQELLGSAWCGVIFKELSSRRRWLPLVWMTPVPSITRPGCHRWRNNNRPNYPALHTWLHSAHCSPTNLEDGSLGAWSPGAGGRWAQVVARASLRRSSGGVQQGEGALRAGTEASAPKED